MADTKISALPASTVPLAGTEVLPIVQSSATKQVSVANLTAGRAISATELTLTTGSVIVASGQGVDFSATPGTGTSELFADYEEGTWTPIDTSGAGLTITVSNARYTKIGRMVYVLAYIVYPSTVNATAASIGGLPFTVQTGQYAVFNATSGSGTAISVQANSASTSTTIVSPSNFNVAIPNATLSTAGVLISGQYNT